MTRSRRDVSKSRPQKVVDEARVVRSRSGRRAMVREEVWVDRENSVVRYNLAYINFYLCRRDNGRMLGYDNAHGRHERHTCGSVEEVMFERYEKTAETFYAELRKLKENS